MRPQFSIAWLLVIVGFSGVAIAALGYPSPLWANTVFTVAFVSLVIATINVVYGRGRPRAFWAGFLIAGGTYFVTYSVPSLRESVCPKLVTEPLLDLMHPWVSPQSAPPVPVFPVGFGSMMYGGSTSSGSMMGAMPWTPAPVGRWALWTDPTGGGPIASGSPESFRQVGHSLLILLFAGFGGVYARSRYDRR